MVAIVLAACMGVAVAWAAHRDAAELQHKEQLLARVVPSYRMFGSSIVQPATGCAPTLSSRSSRCRVRCRGRAASAFAGP